MSEASEIARRRVVYSIEGMDALNVQRDEPYLVRDDLTLCMDLYYPSQGEKALRPAVVLVTGYRDVGWQRRFGCLQKEMGSFVSWAHLIAASGMVAVTYSNDDPVEDAKVLISILQDQSQSWGIDSRRIGIWATSGHAPNAFSIVMKKLAEPLRCAVFSTGYTLDVPGASHVATAARTWKFVNPREGRSVTDIDKRTALFVARAGADQMPGLNEGLDQFVFHALANDLPLTVVNHPEAPHAFDLFEDTERSRIVVRQMLNFLQVHLLG